MLPEVAAYFEAMNDYDYYEARRQVDLDFPYRHWYASLPAEERAACYEADTKRAEAFAKVEIDWKERQAKALESLLNSDDPLVRWLASTSEVYVEYRSHAEEVLRNLPMSREELEEFGDRQSWCAEYRRLFLLADRAGVLPEPTPELADFGPLLDEFVRWYGGSAHIFERMIKKHIPAIVESAKRLAAEKDEQQVPQAA